jgi:UDP-N-acetyl-D-mannosaminuronate dehydrogenase
MEFSAFQTRPGRGHCIGVDPYYLTHKAESLGYLPEVILAGRRINDGMGKYIAAEVVKLMIRKGQKIFGAKVLMLGITFKENCPDIRNSRAVDVVRGLEEFGCQVELFDPWADPDEVKQIYGVNASRAIPASDDYDAVILAVAHREFAALDLARFKKEHTVVYDIKGILPKDSVDGRL